MNLVTSSIAIIKQNQSAAGAFIASPHFSVYEYCWFRDGSWIAHAMLLHGEEKSAERFHDWAAQTIIKYKEKIFNAIKKHKQGISIGSDFIDARYTTEGDEINMQWGNFQLDGLGVWLWSLSEYMRITKKSKELWLSAAALACDYLKELWSMPCYDLWEENPDHIHTSTLASIYGGLYAWKENFPEYEIEKVCKKIKKFIVKQCVHKNVLVKYVGSTDVDASALMCAVPFNVFSVNEAVMEHTAKKIVRELKVSEGLRRYTADTYYGGGEWIILGAWLAWYYALIGEKEKSKNILHRIEQQATEEGNLPEQLHPRNQKLFEKWKSKWGEPASPLLWSHAMYLVMQSVLEKLAK